MVNNQLLPSQISNENLLEAMSELPRHMFVDKKYSEVAYIDAPLPVTKARKILEPLLFAKMVEACKIKSSSKVLDIGCGLGYSSIVLSNMAEKVIGVENDISLTNQAKYLAGKLEVKNCFFETGELLSNFAKEFLFDVIFVNGALSKGADLLAEQLKEGGKMILIQPSESLMKVVLHSKSKKGLSKSELFVSNAEFLN